MLKTKAGEANALDNLAASAKSRIKPVLHVTSSVAASFAKTMGSAWSGRPLSVDGRFSFNSTGSTAPFTAVVNSMRSNGIPAIPSISTDAHGRLIAAAVALVNKDGVMVRTPWYDLPNLATFIATHGWSSSEVDVVLDVGEVSAVAVPAMATAIANSLVAQFGSSQPYRSLTLASSAAPKDHGGLAYGPSNIPRRDWELWNATRTQIPFQVDFADYASGHPDLTEPPGVAMASATVSARYAMLTDWLIIKGRRTTGASGIPMGTQYKNHAAQYVANAQFGGIPNCWADDMISKIHAGSVTPGNRTTWSAIAVNRHLSLVESQLP